MLLESAKLTLRILMFLKNKVCVDSSQNKSNQTEMEIESNAEHLQKLTSAALRPTVIRLFHEVDMSKWIKYGDEPLPINARVLVWLSENYFNGELNSDDHLDRYDIADTGEDGTIETHHLCAPNDPIGLPLNGVVAYWMTLPGPPVEA